MVVWNRFAVVRVWGILLAEDENGVDIEGRGGEGTETGSLSAMVYLLMGETDVVKKTSCRKEKKLEGKREVSALV